VRVSRDQSSRDRGDERKTMINKLCLMPCLIQMAVRFDFEKVYHGNVEKIFATHHGGKR